MRYNEFLTSPIGADKNWSQLLQLAQQPLSLNQLLQCEQRPVEYSISAKGLYYDYSKQLINDAIKHSLVALAQDCKLENKRDKMFAGAIVNSTESRAVLHTALRAKTEDILLIDGIDIRRQIAEQKAAMFRFVEEFQNQKILGATGKVLDTIINIGIGGSDLGPKLVCTALAKSDIVNKLHFISNVDGACLKRLLEQVDLERSLVIIQSKTFTTAETLLNAQTIIKQLQKFCHLQSDLQKHLVAVTASVQKAQEFGISAERTFQFWDWVGGRYSLWSVIGLPIALAIGTEGFQHLLDGAEAMDSHFLQADLEKNMPVMAALVGIWNRNFLHYKDYALIPYSENLYQLPFYVQQLDMESNGKTVAHSGQLVEYETGPVVWGQTGTNGQHAFFQLLHQGSSITPVDFVGIIDHRHSIAEHHKILNSNMVAQSIALALGKGDCTKAPHQYYSGNRPSSTLLLSQLNDQCLGALIAFYEHKVFVQGVIWGINSFDQWGVELGKSLANAIQDNTSEAVDPCSARLMDLLQIKS